jgi:hypothetical protein
LGNNEYGQERIKINFIRSIMKKKSEIKKVYQEIISMEEYVDTNNVEDRAAYSAVVMLLRWILEITE